MKFYNTTLSNGLTVLAESRPSAIATGVGFFVKTGARDETPELSGVSHFLEHMLFKGTERRSALDITFELAAIGAQANAYTSEETTVYYAAVLPEYLEKAFDIISDMMRPALDPQEFATEKKVILEEIALYEDRPTHVLFENSLREYFSDHPAGNPVLGSHASVSALTVEQMNGYFDERYSPKNITLVVSGVCDWEKVVELAEKHCSAWPAVEAPREVTAHLPKKSEKTLTKENLNVAHACLIGPGPSAAEDERYPAGILGCVLGDGTGSRVYWELVDNGLAESAAIDVDEMDGTGLLYGYVSGEPAKLDELSEILVGIMKTPTKFSDDDLERAKTKIATRLVLQGESSMRRLMAIGNDWIYRNNYLPLKDELERVQRVTREDISKMLARYPFEPYTTVKLIPA